MHTSNDFVLHGGNMAFANRQKLLFDKLSSAEKECNKNKSGVETINVPMEIEESSNVQHPRTSQKRKSETKRFRGKESIFKRPEGPAPRASCRSMPDHRRNPHKWIKYSLDDVTNEDMTDQSNTKAALSFLKELRERTQKVARDTEEIMDIEGSQSSEQRHTKFRSRRIKTNSEIEFKKPDIQIESTESTSVIVDSDDKPVFRSSKIIMPEYVVGQKQKKKEKKEKKDKPLVKVDRLKQLKLDHLEEIDEEDN